MLLLGIACLVTGIWGGLVRLPMVLPLPAYGANWITFHGPLMVCGFLGTVIGLERAVGLRYWWTYAAPLLTGAGSVMLVGGMLGKLPLVLITVGSIWFVAVSLYVVKLQPVLFTKVMAGGAIAWAAGNVFWYFDWPINRVVPWWVGFLAFTIVGERLDLSRFQKPSPWSLPVLTCSLSLAALGLVLCAVWQVAGERVFGAGLLAMALWLGRFDIARRTVRQPGLPRFMASTLLVGYFWLAVAGVLMVSFSPLTSGLRYDSILHAFFVGFVFSMIFAHAPVIFPAVLAIPPVFSTRFYFHVALLEAGLLMRVMGDLTSAATVRQWGAIVSGIAVAVFLLSTVSALLLRKPEPKPAKRAVKV